MAFNKKHAFLAALTRDLKMFATQAFHELHPNTEFLDNWHIDAIIHILESCIQGDVKRAIINMPPRQLKSELISVALPAFLLTLDPSTKIICVSYNEDLAKDLSRKTRRIIQSKWYQQLFPHVRLLKTAESEIETDQGGGRLGTSIGGTMTGKGGDFIIVDDPSKSGTIASDPSRSVTNSWFGNTLASRLDDKKYGVIIVVMQRLHVNDLTGYIENGLGFHKLCLPAIATRTEVIPLRNGLTYTRKAGELLHPKREGLAELDAIRAQMGAFLFSAQYQQDPQTPEGGLFKLKYFKIVDQMPPKSEYGYYCVSIDCATSTSDSADYTAITVAYISEGICTVILVDRGRWHYEVIRDKATSLVRQFRSDVLFIVERANVGESLCAFLKEQSVRVHPYHPIDSKLGRAAQMLPEFEAGRVHLLKREGKDNWITPLINEFVSFPGCRYDDQVDSLVQLVYFAKKSPYPFGRIFIC